VLVTEPVQSIFFIVRRSPKYDRRPYATRFLITLRHLPRPSDAREEALLVGSPLTEGVDVQLCERQSPPKG
jgi:hypothetical protein